MVASSFAPQTLPRVSLLKGVTVQARVIGALVLRELHTRYGRSNIGYLWLIGEPLMLASVISLLHMSSESHSSGGISPMAFTLTGYCLFCVFRGIFTRAEGAIESNQSLLHHHVVTITDIVVSRAIIDAVGAALAFVILFSLVCVIGLAEPPARPLHLIAGYLFMFWWSLALAFIAVSVTYEKHTLGRMMHVLSYFSIPISGAFISLSLMPPVIRQYLAYFPMALIFEQARYGTFRSASDTWVDPAYVAFWCLVLTYIGLLLMRRLRRRVAVR